MTTDRPYRPAMPVVAALQELRDKAGSQFDPFVAEILIQIVEGSPTEGAPALSAALG